LGNEYAQEMSAALTKHRFSPFLGTPCGVLASLYTELDDKHGLLTVVREDNAVGIAAGSALAGASPVVLMQNSGLGQSVNAIASLVVPYLIPMLFVIGMRGTSPDATAENEVMGRMTPLIFAAAGIPAVLLDGDEIADQVAWGADLVTRRRMPAALLVPPTLFGWRP
jgi:sulfopyruvate decarboxylase subunit alpha